MPYHTPEITRDSQIVLLALFSLGKKSSVAFRRPRILHPRTKAAFDELVQKSILKSDKTEYGDRSQGIEYSAGSCFPDNVWKLYPAFTEAESFPITTE